MDLERIYPVPLNERLFQVGCAAWLCGRSHPRLVRREPVKGVRHEAQRAQLCGHLQRGIGDQIHHIEHQII